MTSRFLSWLRPVRQLGLALLGTLAAATVSAAPAPERIVAVGDLHGDFKAWRTIAEDARLIDPAGRWIGGKTLLVQLGDIADRGPGTLDIIADLKRLQVEAARSGGRVVVLIGNHEAMNATGDNRYVTADEYAAFVTPRSPAIRERFYIARRAEIEAAARIDSPQISPAAARERWLKVTPLGWVEHQQAWAPGGAIGRWLAGNPAIARVGDTLFVHGGISAETSATPIETINARVASALARGDTGPNSPLVSPLSPLWYRGLVMRDADAEAARSAAGTSHPARSQELDIVLGAYGAKRLVVAHTPNLAGVAILGDGKLIRVDTGISAYYGGKLGWLEILGDRLIPHEAQRR